MIKQRHHLVLVLAILTGVASFFLLSGTSSAATINVTTTDTPSAVDGNCTLREAIENINDQPTQTNLDCTAGDGVNDTITIPAGTITLQADLPLITKSVSIQGAGMGATTVSGNGQWHVVVVSNPAGTFSINDLSISRYRSQAIGANANATSLSHIEVDGSNALFDEGIALGIGVGTASPTPATVQAEDIYVHDINGIGTGSGVSIGLAVSTDGQARLDAVINRITVARIRNDGPVQGITAGQGLLDASPTLSADGNALISNITVDDIESVSNFGVGIGVINISRDSSTLTATVTNSTVNNVRGAQNLPIKASGLGSIAAADNAGQTATTELTSINNLLANTDNNCVALDFGPIVGSQGTGVTTLTSGGGNLSDDNSCSPYFTQPTDQNNLTGLAATLSALADNGGYVPTMALKQGSPAIDSGITVAGLTTDARGAARPQGSAYDSGAYESPYTKPAVVTAAAKPTLASSGQNSVLAAGLATFAMLATAVLFARRRKFAIL